MSDLTPEAAQTDEAGLMRREMAMSSELRALRAELHALRREHNDADAIAAFLASPPDWLTALVRRFALMNALYAAGCGDVLAAVPPALRSAAGLDTP